MTVLTLDEMFGVILIALAIYRVVTPEGWRRTGFSVVN
jgi:hypothetical protein